MSITPADLHRWCSVSVDELSSAPTRIPFRLVSNAEEMGQLMARELVDLVDANNRANRATRVIVPCGPVGWYAPFAQEVTSREVSLAAVDVFHMDEMLDWEGRPLPEEHPMNFKSYMERHFYGPIPEALAVPHHKRHWLLPETAQRIAEELSVAPIDMTVGGWGQDGHVAYNQARRHPFSTVDLDRLRASTIRVQENNLDTVLALAHRSFGAAFQLVPPMSITLGMRECLSAAKVRLFSDTGAWKQTAFRVALFAEPTPEYPITLLQEHPDALLTATLDTAQHVLSEHPEWVFE